ncbi:unnamed protein product [Calypogeia fissa]
MADATTFSRLTSIAHAKPRLCSSHCLCLRQTPLHPLLVCNKCIPNTDFYSQHAVSGSLAIQSCPKLLTWTLSSHRHGGIGGRASQHLVLASSRPSSSRAEDSNSDADLPPSSKEEVVEQAGASLFTLLEKTLKKQGPTTVKQRKSQRQIRLRVDIPLLDGSPQALLTLTEDLLDSFLAGGKKGFGKIAVYFCDSALVDKAIPSSSATYHSLESSEDLPHGAVCVLVIAPTFQQAAALESVVKNAGVRPVIVVNPEWSEEEEGDKKWGPFLVSFCAAYSFIPLNIQGFFSKTEGVVLKRVRSGAPEAQPWLIYVKEGDKYKCVSRLKKRPTPTDLENALYGSMAANSPVNKSIAFLRGLVSK